MVTHCQWQSARGRRVQLTQWQPRGVTEPAFQGSLTRLKGNRDCQRNVWLGRLAPGRLPGSVEAYSAVARARARAWPRRVLTES